MPHTLLPSSTPIRVLIAEDDPLDAELVVDELTQAGLRFESRRVDDEAEFNAALKEFGPDVVVSDLSMPGFSGERALDLLTATRPEVPFIYFSGTIGEEAAIAALQRGAADYVLKNNPVRLASSVSRALRDAADRRSREEAEAGLVRAQRFESMGMLAGGLSHDLRNILQPLLITADTIGDHPDPQVRKFAELVEDCAQRGLEMVASMLSFARGTRNQSERIRVGHMLDALAMLLKPSVPSRIEVKIKKPDPDVTIAGNQTELQQTLLNLCLNAIQAIPERGKLSVIAEPGRLEDDFFQTGEVPREGNYLRIDVRDSGSGMSADVLENLFRPFFTTKEDGTGLGLVSCKRIAENHLGYLRVD
ncbi:MAG: response regulator, partial [Dokdonella sp.]